MLFNKLKHNFLTLNSCTRIELFTLDVQLKSSGFTS